MVTCKLSHVNCHCCYFQGFVPLFSTWESFYTRHVFRRVSDVLSIPVAGVPAARMKILKRVTHDYGWSYE